MEYLSINRCIYKKSWSTFTWIIFIIWVHVWLFDHLMWRKILFDRLKRMRKFLVQKYQLYKTIYSLCSQFIGKIQFHSHKKTLELLKWGYFIVDQIHNWLDMQMHVISQTTYLFTYESTAISWRSVKQTLVATSSNHSEIIAIDEASRECI